MNGKFAVLTTLFIISCEVFGDPGIVKIDGGNIEGKANEQGYEFLGIPYAEPPVGKRRFDLPQTYSQTWQGTRKYDKYGPVCAQFSHFDNGFIGEEDCLTLNVFVPVHVMESKEKSPVIFYIHGGAFMFGSGKYYGGENFMNSQNMILVTINYRLGVLGFLSFENEDLPGNLGMKDQVEALKWVQRNIEAFNGDPKKVTITGFSAGGASVHLHFMSPLTDGLFQNGISHSGVAINPWVMQEDASSKAKNLGIAMNCQAQDSRALLRCLKGRPVKDLVMFIKEYQPYLYNPFSPLGVVVESPSKSAYIINFPKNLLKEGNFKRLPWIVSQTEDEGLYPAAEFFNDVHLKAVDEQWDELAPFLNDYNLTSDDDSKKREWSEAIRKFYFDDKQINKDTFNSFRQMMTDRLFHHGAHVALELHSKFAATYCYFFRFETLNVLPIAPCVIYGTDKCRLGIAHGDDVFLIYFNIESRGPSKPSYNEGEKLVSKHLLNMYYAFSNTGDPLYDGANIEKIKKKLKCLDISEADVAVMTHKDDTFGQISFWNELKVEDQILFHSPMSFI